MTFEYSQWSRTLPPYPVQELGRMRDEARAREGDLVDLGGGGPDRSTPPAGGGAPRRAAEDLASHQHPLYSGLDASRESGAGWCRRRRGAALNSGTEIRSLIGSKGGFAHFSMTFADPGDVVLAPELGSRF